MQDISLMRSIGSFLADEVDGGLELRLAEKYNQQSKELMEEGFQRLAATLKELSEQYRRDAERVKRDYLPDDME